MSRAGRIFVAGHRGMVGAAIVRALRARGEQQLLLKTRAELDLCDAGAVAEFFTGERPETVILAAARVGGIHANATYPAQFLHDNLAMELNVIREAWKSGTQRLLFLGSSCIYPREAPQPIREDSLLTGPLEKTNEAYALAKIAGLKLCQFFRAQYGVLFHSAMPCNLYGPGDNYHPENSHVLPALLRRFHEAREAGAEEVAVWGTGKPRREFLHVDDLADGLLRLLDEENPPDWVNIGYGSDVTIAEAVEVVARVTGYEGTIAWDASRPDGTMHKLMDSSRFFATGWRPRLTLEAGLRDAYRDFLEHRAKGDVRAI